MKYVFIVNPTSGQGKHSKGLVPQIEALIQEHPDKDIKIYYTRGVKDATTLADQIAKEAQEIVRIFACGGDGTIQEVCNGIYGHDNAELGIIPVGSGNDFVRALGGDAGAKPRYLDLNAQIDAPAKKIDLIRMTWTSGGKEHSCLVDNGINIGFDGNTAILASEYKNLPGVSGTGSYILALAKNLVLKKGEDLRVIADGNEIFNGPLLLATVANGGFCGGGFESCPRADLSDGLLEVLVINNMSRTKFLTLVPKYKDGKIFDVKNDNNKLFTYTQAEEIIIEPNNGSMQFVADGEKIVAESLKLEVVKEAISVAYL